MLLRRTPFLNLLVGGWVLLVLSSGPVFAQDAAKPDDPKPEVDEKPTPWPPPGTEKHEIKREAEQETGLVLYTPASWKRAEKPQTLRLAEFAVPPAAGEKDAVDLSVFSFQGIGGGGGVQANVQRWISQFPTATKKEILTGSGHQGLYVLVDLEGTYQPPQFREPVKPAPIQNARMLAAIIGIRWQGKDAEGKPKEKSAVYFLKMVGTKKTIDANEAAFRLAFGATNKSKENPIPEKEE